VAEWQLRYLIDYYLNHQSPSWPVYISAAALAISVLALFISREQIRTSSRHHVRGEWNGLMDACIQNPSFIDIAFTSNYLDAQDEIIINKYEAFCYKAWSLVEFIVQRKLQTQNPYSTIVSWVVAYHRDWLEKNPYMFSSGNFWRVYNAVRNEPLTLFRHQGMPRVGTKPAVPDADRYLDNVDWDKVSTDYHNLIISPWAPEMTEPHPRANGQPRNCLLGALRAYAPGELRKLRVADFGCGPGNILRFLEGQVDQISGVDISRAALDMCKREAPKYGIRFNAIEADMREFVADAPFDVIICTNSVLPKHRDDVGKIFRGMANNLKDGGRILMILPSYDTCLYLVDLWAKYYRSRSNDEAYVQRCINAFRGAKKVDDVALSFADDGVHSQCFHTPESIKKEFKESGLEIVGELRKVLYPWEYAKKFDYGYFPDKDEIWDWFVEARKSAVVAPEKA
jgi:2-polyprenyl-3-methyl-5-hydroxy-6-metoxy-1,4-benzoquinol methylase